MKRIFIFILVLALIGVILYTLEVFPKKEKQHPVDELVQLDQEEIPVKQELCFVHKAQSGFDFATENDFDYIFLKLEREGNFVKGNFEYDPFATDSSWGTIEGVVLTEENNEIVIDGLYNWEAEGMTGTSEQAIRINNNEEKAYVSYGITEQASDGVWRYTGEGITGWWEVPSQTCADYDLLYQENLS